MKRKLVLTAITAFVVGTYTQYKYDRINLKKKAPAIIEQALEKTRSESFKAGWKRAVEDPTIRLQHYNEFKDLMNQV